MQTTLPFGNSEVFTMYYHQANDIVSGEVASRGSWELSETHFLATKMHEFAESVGKRHDEVYLLDIGANIGAHTLFAAAFGFSVIAFEPLRPNALAIRHSLCASPALGPRVTLFNKGLGSEALHCGVYSGNNNIGDGVFDCGGAQQLGPEYERRSELDTVRLDDVLGGEWLPRLAGRVGVVKIDVEGFEPSVLAGGLAFLRAVRPPWVMSEVSDRMMGAATGKKASDYFQEIHALGYKIRKDSFEAAAIPPEALPNYSEPEIRNYWFTLS